MTDYVDPWAVPDVAPDAAADALPDVSTDAPGPIIDLVDGRESLIWGDPEGLAIFDHQQGDNPYGFEGTCGLVSCEQIIDQFGIEVSEGDIVGLAIEHGWCQISDEPAESGGTTEADWINILDHYGIPAHAESGRSMEDLADHVEAGEGVIIAVNSGVIWGNYFDALISGFQPDHAVIVTGVARETDTGDILGFYINDSNDADADGRVDGGRFIDRDTMEMAWEFPGGRLVATDIPRPLWQSPLA